MNATAPFKLDAFGYATELSEQARCAGATRGAMLPFLKRRAPAYAAWSTASACCSNWRQKPLHGGAGCGRKR